MVRVVRQGLECEWWPVETSNQVASLANESSHPLIDKAPCATDTRLGPSARSTTNSASEHEYGPGSRTATGRRIEAIGDDKSLRIASLTLRKAAELPVISTSFPSVTIVRFTATLTSALGRKRTLPKPKRLRPAERPLTARSGH